MAGIGRKARSVTLDDETVCLARLIGEGNVSKGISEAVKHYSLIPGDDKPQWVNAEIEKREARTEQQL